MIIGSGIEAIFKDEKALRNLKHFISIKIDTSVPVDIILSITLSSIYLELSLKESTKYFIVLNEYSESKDSKYTISMLFDIMKYIQY